MMYKLKNILEIFFIIVVSIICIFIITNHSIAETSENIKLAIIENDVTLPSDSATLLSNLGEDFKIGNQYIENVATKNMGTSNCYVKCTVSTNWKNQQDEIQYDLDPNIIELIFNEENWIEDYEFNTPNQRVYYYNQLLTTGNSTDPLLTNIMISNFEQLLCAVKNVGDENNIQYVQIYAGKKFEIKVEFEAIEEANAQEVASQEWNPNITIEDGNLSL